jgi:protein-disulfide isomerase
MDAAIAAGCAQKQGRFWSYADLLFTHQDQLTKEGLEAFAKQNGLNLSQYRLCIADSATKAAILSDQAQALKLGIRYTPTIIVNRLKIEEMLPEDELNKVIEDELTRAK